MKVWRHSLEHPDGKLKTVKMSKASLGEFMYWACKFGCRVGRVWPFNPKYDGCWVGITIEIEEKDIDRFQELSGFGLKKPPKVKLS
jgi:hypothetical protein